MNGPTSPGHSDHERQAERWLTQLRDGGPPQKAEARRQLAVIFAARGMTNDAIELLVANAQAGYRDAWQFETLARLYRVSGNEYLAATAAMEAARLRQGGRTSPPTPPQPGQTTGNAGGGGQGPYAGQRAYRPPPSAPPSDSAPPPLPHGQSAPSTAFLPLGPRWERPLRILGWVLFAGMVIGAMAALGTSPLAAVAFAIAAGALGLLLAGAPGIRRTLRVPVGPLGDGSMLLLAILAFLVGGALLPRGSSAPADGAGTSGPLYAGTPTPAAARPGGPTPSPATAAAPGTGPGAAPGAAGQSVPSPGPGAVASPADTTGQRFIVAADVRGTTLQVSPSSTRGGTAVGDGTLVVSLAADRVTSGRVWREVSAPDGEKGWIEIHRLKPAPTEPLPNFPNGRPPTGRACTGGTSIKGYLSSDGELLYQRTGSEHYYRTFPVVCFRTEDEARAAGFQPGPGVTGAAPLTPAPSGQAADQRTSSGPDPPAPDGGPSQPLQVAAGTAVQIVHAGNEGVRLRPAPDAEEILKVLPEGAPLVSLGEEQEDGGRQWRRVRDPDGTEGWVAADFLAAVAVTPKVVAVATARPTVTVVADAAPPPPTPQPTQPPAPPTTAPAPPVVAVVPPASAPKPQPAATATAAPKPAAATPAPTARPATPTAQPPVARAQPSGMDCPSAQPIKGNHSSSGERIYHPPSGQFYSRTRPEACFATEAEARQAGYRPSQR